MSLSHPKTFWFGVTSIAISLGLFGYMFSDLSHFGIVFRGLGAVLIPSAIGLAVLAWHFDHRLFERSHAVLFGFLAILAVMMSVPALFEPLEIEQSHQQGEILLLMLIYFGIGDILTTAGWGIKRLTRTT